MDKNDNSIFKEIINHIPYYIFWKDLDLNYIGANDLFAKSAGFKNAEDIIGKCDYDGCWTKEEADFFRSIDKKVIDSKEPILNLEEPQQQLDGSTKTLLTSKVPLLDAHGNAFGILGIYTDISSRKNLEKEKDAALVQIQKMQEILVQQEKMKSLGEMAGGIAHEINNPLSIILANASMIKSTVEAGKVDDNLLKYCDKIMETVSRCTEIVKNLRSFSRNPDDVAIEDVAARSIVDYVVSLVTARTKSFEGTFETLIGDEILNCKQLSVEQALVNLIGNAFDASANIESSKILIRSFTREGRVGIEVLNTGEKIPPEILGKIFDPFFTTKEVGKGTGLGLSTSRGLINNCGGELTYYYENEMNVFSISFNETYNESMSAA